MPTIIAYPDVLHRLTTDGWVSLYHNGGAFGLPAGVDAHVAGWIGPPDPTIRPAAAALARTVAPPYPQTLSRLLAGAWRKIVRGELAWVMPMSHWSFELDFASHAWLPQVLRQIGIDAAALAPLNNAAAISFAADSDEADALEHLARSLLTQLTASDFCIAFPGRPAACMLHHHQQLWWTTPDAALAEQLRCGLD